MCLAKFLVAFSHGRGVTECFRCKENINRDLFSYFVTNKFSHIFSKGNNQKGKLFLQDGDPSQNCNIPQEAMDNRLFRISPRFPGLNPIENKFHLAAVCLRKQNIKKKIKRETYKDFCIRVTNTLHNFPSDIID